MEETLRELIDKLEVASIVVMGPEHPLPVCSYGNPENLKDYYGRTVENYWVDPEDITLYATLGGEQIAEDMELKRA